MTAQESPAHTVHFKSGADFIEASVGDIARRCGEGRIIESDYGIRCQYPSRWPPMRQESDLQRREAEALKLLFVRIHVDEASEERDAPLVTIARILALERDVFAHIGIVRGRYGLQGIFGRTN